MKTLQPIIKYNSKGQQRRFWLGCFIILVVSLLLLYCGYCWGLLGRQSLLLQFLFQCNCPTPTHSFRYSNRVEVIIPACDRKAASIKVSPQGTMVDVNHRYILDLRTGERTAPPSERFYKLLSADLFFIDSLTPYVLNIRKDLTSPVEYLYNLPTLDDGRINPAAILPILRSAENVYIIEDVILIQGDSNKYYAIKEYQLVGHTRGGTLARDFLDANEIDYEFSVDYFSDELPSHNGKFIARLDGIYLAATNERIIENYRLPNNQYPAPIGWRYDDQGVILRDGGIWLLDFSDDLPAILQPQPIRFIQVYQPILLLKVPSEY